MTWATSLTPASCYGRSSVICKKNSTDAFLFSLIICPSNLRFQALKTRRRLRSCSFYGRSAGSRSTHVLRSELKDLINKMKPREEFGEEIMRLIAGATSAPIAQYIASPTTPLHSLDPRVKQAWLFALVFLPSRSHMVIRLGLVFLLALISVWFLPRRVWQDQLGRMVFISGLLLIMVSLGTDGVPPLVQTRTPPPAMDGLPAIPQSLGGYSYVICKLGPIRLTRKGLALGVTASCLSFTVLQSASLCLTTTMPEHLAAGLRWYLTPLAYFKAPVDEIVLTLLLSLRFIGLVFDEVRNVALGVVARGVQWKHLTLLETADVFFTFLGRVFKNLFNHAEQIAQAMIVRGFRGNPVNHKVHFLTEFSIKLYDFAALAILALLIGLAVLSEICLI